MDNLIRESIEHSFNEFYEKKFYFSYSSLNKLLWNPAVFFQIYVLGMRQDTTSKSLIEGKVIHALLLNKEEFDKEFIVSPKSIPTSNTKVVIDRIYNHHSELISQGFKKTELIEYKDAVLDVLSDMNLHQSLKTDEQRIEKIITSETLSYWDYLKNSQGKTIITEETYNYCLRAVDAIKENKEISKMMGLDVSQFDDIEVFNEQEMSVEKFMHYPFGLKGVLDNLVIDHANKRIIINDLKTTSKDLKDFPESVEYYSYWMQAVIYIILVYGKYQHLLQQNYQLSFNFIVIDSNFVVYDFGVSESTLSTWFDRFKQKVEIAMFHYSNRSYDLPYELAHTKYIL